jgi:uncharacterized protein (TIGR02246 family)
MRSMTRLSIALAMASTCFVAFVAFSKTAAPAPIEAQLRNLDGAWESAVQAKDLERILSFYAEDASGLFNGRPIVTGKAALKRDWQDILARPNLNLHWTPTRIDVAKSGDLAYDVGTVTSSMTDPKGNTVNFIGKYVVVWKKQADGNWQVAIDMSNSDR